MNSKVETLLEKQAALDVATSEYADACKQLLKRCDHIIYILRKEFEAQKHRVPFEPQRIAKTFKKLHSKRILAMEVFHDSTSFNASDCTEYPPEFEISRDKQNLYFKIYYVHTLVLPVLYLDLSREELICQFRSDIVDPLIASFQSAAKQFEAEERKELARLITLYGVSDNN